MGLQGQTLERTGSKTKEPKRYNVIMLNDDFTTMDFVVAVLIDIFHKDQLTAEALMLDVHKKGKAVVGTYSYDIAVTKTRTAMQRARDEGFPFRMLVEEA
ncbi:MAG: ATP-dependent Clp protease adaptor ClpS [Oscillospiraceae bacterium]|jgi:ATP-dependent Clp protease adaptor protein ClpS|nr:ATP-dependent Clp protease adaptor ClpS [Oscillospiraceae bacterium]MBQ5335887.1 ATP-dependent Clp protease adaptor ClpS [Oscillospiraceae bacterium]MBR3025894.1 ATP-dependent Clp protease adaptor ClpS [Oscillospiraceae bacterium]